MKIQKIFTEQPEEEMWRMILHFSYPNNIKEYMNKTKQKYTDELIECISGSILQAKEYFAASACTTLQIEPLMLYYGTTNLLFGMLYLKTGKMFEIKHHGMEIKLDINSSQISKTVIHPKYPQKGFLNIINNYFLPDFNFCMTGDWLLEELFASIPELLYDFIECYSSDDFYLLPIEIVKQKRTVVHKIRLDIINKENFLKLIEKIPNFYQTYLIPDFTDQNIILRPKLNSKETGVYAYSGKMYLQVGHEKNGKVIIAPTIIYLLMSLFALGSLCRYYPQKWNPFIKNDLTGEKLFIEKFLYFSRRLIPNIVLNYIHDKRIWYGNTFSYRNYRFCPLNSLGLR